MKIDQNVSGSSTVDFPGISESVLIRSNACPICDGAMAEVLDLPAYPLTELYEPWDACYEPGRARVDQAMLFCAGCGHGKLEATVAPSMLYGKGYRTRTAASRGATQAAISFSSWIKSKVNLTQLDVVLDIGGNDGTLLRTFRGLHGVAVDPHAYGPNDILKFIEDADLQPFKGRRKLIVSSHTIEHLANPAAMLAKVSSILCYGDAVALQFPSLEMLIGDARIDQISHQHVQYFSERSISALLARFGMEVTAARFDPDHYGALMVLARRGKGQARGRVILGVQIVLADLRFRGRMRAVHEPEEFMAAGAALMLPVLAYHLPWLSRAQVIYDGDASKHDQRYVNFPVRISKDASMAGRDVVITGVATKEAARSLTALACTMGARNVVIPVAAL